MSGASAVQAEDQLADLLALLEIPGGPGDEREVATYLTARLIEAGVEQSQIVTDQAHERIGTGEQGNLIVSFAGRGRLADRPRRLFSAHMDTVPLCVGNSPIVDGEWVIGRDETKALGGDDRSGCAVLLSTARQIARSQADHPPLTFLWTVQEEVGLRGARHAAVELLGDPIGGFNFDNRDPNAILIGATGDVAITLTIHGLASHAGLAPEAGVSAAAVLGKAVARLIEAGWHGQIKQGSQRGTSNIGVIQGGAATNVVMDRLYVRAEARSHSSSFRKRIVKEWRSAFEQAASETVSVHGHAASIEWEDELKYESFALKEDSPIVQSGLHSMRAVGLKPEFVIGNGGLDANWLSEHGIPTVTFGCGQDGIHTVNERLHVPSFHKACELAIHLATSTD